MEEPPSSIIDRRTAIIAFLREALMEGGVSHGELEVKAREAGLLGRLQSISHAKLFKEAKKILGIRSVRTGFGQSGKWLWEYGLPPAPTTASAVQLLKAGVGTAGAYPAAFHQTRRYHVQPRYCTWRRQLFLGLIRGRSTIVDDGIGGPPSAIGY